jgi:hypothetical protein
MPRPIHDVTRKGDAEGDRELYPTPAEPGIWILVGIEPKRSRSKPTLSTAATGSERLVAKFGQTGTVNDHRRVAEFSA